MIEVSAGIIRRPDGQIMVCQRGEGRHNAHLWEFPGGKREPGEDAAACLKRELLEELSLPVSQVEVLCTREAEGISFTFLTGQTEATPIATEHEDIRFCTPRELLALPFCPADTWIARKLAFTGIRHFLWDFDGTLADTYPGLTLCLDAACRQYGFAEDHTRLLNLLKNELPYALHTLAAEHGVDENDLHAAYTAARKIYDEPNTVPFEGILPLLERLTAQGARHCLVTHRDIGVYNTLKNWGVDTLFAGHMLRGDEGFVRKPAPDGIRHLLQTARIPADTAVMIGDRPLDVLAGRGAGTMTILLDMENRFPDTPCDLRVSSVQELADLF